jgi:hypothetical protein
MIFMSAALVQAGESEVKGMRTRSIDPPLADGRMITDNYYLIIPRWS